MIEDVPRADLDQELRTEQHEYMVRLAIELRQIGVSELVTRKLLTDYPLHVIDRQLLYLPFRNAKRRSSLIVAAIKDDYERPANMPEGLDETHE